MQPEVLGDEQEPSACHAQTFSPDARFKPSQLHAFLADPPPTRFVAPPNTLCFVALPTSPPTRFVAPPNLFWGVLRNERKAAPPPVIARSGPGGTSSERAKEGASVPSPRGAPRKSDAAIPASHGARKESRGTVAPTFLWEYEVLPQECGSYERPPPGSRAHARQPQASR